MLDVPPMRPARGEPPRCPACGTRLVELERSEVLIDACPECRGVWLDRGELDRILVQERRVAAGADEDEDFFGEVEGRRQRRGERPGEPREDKRRRRRSLLEDLFDFD